MTNRWKIEMNDEQKKTVEILLSEFDNLQFGKLSHGEIVFDGEGIDGPNAGYIDKDGKIDWVSNGG